MIYLLSYDGFKSWESFEYINMYYPEALMDYNRKLNVSDDSYDFGADGPDLVMTHE